MVTSDFLVQPGKVNLKEESLHPSVLHPEPQTLSWGGDVKIPISKQTGQPKPCSIKKPGVPCPELPNQMLFSSYRSLLTVFTVGSRGWWLGTAQAPIPGAHPEAQS